MIVFLTSSPSGPLGVPNDGWLDEKNGFVDNLKRYWKPEMKGLIIASSPDRYERNDEMCDFFGRAFHNSGVPVAGLSGRWKEGAGDTSGCSPQNAGACAGDMYGRFDVWDYRTAECSREALMGYDVIVLSRGHVPTEHAYFQELHLRELLEGFPGIVIGISAGTMNSADVVYVQPEKPGESVDPGFKRFVKGLGLTAINVLPHYHMVRDCMLDGKRLMEEITYPDSMGRRFIALEDGSYILIADGQSRLYGRAHLIADGKIFLICDDGQSMMISE